MSAGSFFNGRGAVEGWPSLMKKLNYAFTSTLYVFDRHSRRSFGQSSWYCRWSWDRQLYLTAPGGSVPLFDNLSDATAVTLA